MKKPKIAMLLAGGVGSRLNILASLRAKPAIPFGGIYRIIDFTMSNLANSQIDVVGVLTQYKPLSLMAHLDNGKPWDLFGRTRRVEILPPKTGEEISDWYKGTSDAVYQNLGFIEDFSPNLVLVVSGDHIYSMDYNVIIDYHKKKKAQATIALIQVPRKSARNFGIAAINTSGRIKKWEEKPANPKSNLASMGIYVFNKEILVRTLKHVAAKKGVDFAKDIIPLLIKKHRVFGFVFHGYWRDVGTVQAYWQANMDLLGKRAGLKLTDWRVKTNHDIQGEIGDYPSTYFSRDAEAQNSLIARGCVIKGQIKNSIISPGVRIDKDVRITDSIIFHNTVIRSHALVEKCIVDKEVSIQKSAVLGKGKAIPNQEYPRHLNTGITIIGKKARIEKNIVVGKNCIIYPDTRVNRSCTSGQTIL